MVQGGEVGIHSFLILLSNLLFVVIINPLLLLIDPKPRNISLIQILLGFQNIIISITMIPTFQGIRMGEPKFLVEYYPPTSLLVKILVLIFCFHVLSGKYALFKFEVYAILAQYFGEYMALHLIDIIENRIAEDKIPLIGRMRMQVQIHKQSLILIIMFPQPHH